jgi:hypothetical protein
MENQQAIFDWHTTDRENHVLLLQTDPLGMDHTGQAHFKRKL